MQGVRIQLLDLADGGQHELNGQYLVSYDADYHWPDGSYHGGKLICTPHVERAPMFPIERAYEIYKSGPMCRCHRKRPDGKPNRPLTAFNVLMG